MHKVGSGVSNRREQPTPNLESQSHQSSIFPQLDIIDDTFVRT
jgi:hypothetical protein